MSNATSYRVFWTNHGYFSAEEFSTLQAAIAYGKSKCFEFSVHFDNKMLGAWGPISGHKSYSQEYKNEVR